VATFDNRVDHGAALSGLGVSEKRPVLLAGWMPKFKD